MRRTLIFATALLASASLSPALAEGVHLVPVVHHSGRITPSCSASVTVQPSLVYDPLSDAAQFTTSVVTLTCNPAQFLATIAISAGNANQFLHRQMWKNGTNSSQVLEYNLYVATDYNSVWGDGTSGSSLKTINRTVGTFNALIFLKFEYRQSSVTAGDYSDTATVTFNLN